LVAQTFLKEYIRYFPECVYSPLVLKVFAEVISALHNKCNKEYDSKSVKLSGKNLSYGIHLPTEIKKIGGILVL
jgi:hypothetical protein